MIILRTVKNFSSLNIAASILLFLMAILAAVIANSPMAPLYQGFLLQELHLRIGVYKRLPDDCFLSGCGVGDKAGTAGG